MLPSCKVCNTEKVQRRTDKCPQYAQHNVRRPKVLRGAYLPFRPIKARRCGLDRRIIHGESVLVRGVGYWSDDQYILCSSGRPGPDNLEVLVYLHMIGYGYAAQIFNGCCNSPPHPLPMSARLASLVFWELWNPWNPELQNHIILLPIMWNWKP